MQQSYSVVIPSHRSFEKQKDLLESLANQSVLPQAIYIVYDKKCTEEQAKKSESQYKTLSAIGGSVILCTKYRFTGMKVNQGSSYARNFGLKQVSTPLALCVDDDNKLPPTFAERCLYWYQKLAENTPEDVSDIVIIPQEELRDTGNIRFSGYKSFHPFWCRPVKISPKEKNDSPYVTALAPSNCFFGKTQTFQKYPFNEKIPHIYEDFFFFAQLRNHGVSLFICPELITKHMMRHKTKLEDLYVANTYGAFQKGRNRTYLMKALADLQPRYDQCIYYILGIWGQTGWLGLHIIILAPGRKKVSLVIALLHGTWVGLFSRIPKDR